MNANHRSNIIPPIIGFELKAKLNRDAREKKGRNFGEFENESDLSSREFRLLVGKSFHFEITRLIRGSVSIDETGRTVIFQTLNENPSSLMDAFNVRVNIYRKCILIPWPSLNTPVINHNVLCIYTHGTDAQGPMRPAFH